MTNERVIKRFHQSKYLSGMIFIFLSKIFFVENIFIFVKNLRI